MTYAVTRRPKRARFNQALVRQALSAAGHKPKQVQAHGDGVGAMVFLSSTDRGLLQSLIPLLHQHGWYVPDNITSISFDDDDRHRLVVQSCGHHQSETVSGAEVCFTCHNIVQFWT